MKALLLIVLCFASAAFAVDDNELRMALAHIQSQAAMNGSTTEFQALVVTNRRGITLADYANMMNSLKPIKDAKLAADRAQFIEKYGCQELVDKIIETQDKLGVLNADGLYVRYQNPMAVIALKYESSDTYNTLLKNVTLSASDLRDAALANCKPKPLDQSARN